MSSAAVSGRRRVPEWLNSFLAVQGELPAPTGYLTPSTVSLDQLPDVGIQVPVRRPNCCGRSIWPWPNDTVRYRDAIAPFPFLSPLDFQGFNFVFRKRLLPSVA